jgi:hypothetical protein
MPWRRRLLYLGIATVSAACSPSSVAPDRAGGPQSLNINCSLESLTVLHCGAAVSCGLYGCLPGTPSDATQLASWTVNDVNIVRVLEPGRFEATGVGDTYVTAKFQSAEGKRTLSVVVGQPPLPTYTVWGAVSEAGKTVSTGSLDDVLVEIVDGPAPLAGQTLLTGRAHAALPGYPPPLSGHGDYEFQGARPGVYTVRATKAGYAPFEKVVTVTVGSTNGFIQLVLAGGL